MQTLNELIEKNENLSHENKRFGEFFKKLGLCPATITDIIINGLEEDWEHQMNHNFHMWKFSNSDEGSEILKKYYMENCSEENDDFFDFYADNHGFYFHPEVPVHTRIEAIQKTRSWCFANYSCDSDEVERFDKDDDMFMNYCYINHVPVPKGLRVGVEKINPKTKQKELKLDSKILFN